MVRLTRNSIAERTYLLIQTFDEIVAATFALVIQTITDQETGYIVKADEIERYIRPLNRTGFVYGDANS